MSIKRALMTLQLKVSDALIISILHGSIVGLILLNLFKSHTLSQYALTLGYVLWFLICTAWAFRNHRTESFKLHGVHCLSMLTINAFYIYISLGVLKKDLGMETLCEISLLISFLTMRFMFMHKSERYYYHYTPYIDILAMLCLFSWALLSERLHIPMVGVWAIQSGIALILVILWSSTHLVETGAPHWYRWIARYRHLDYHQRWELLVPEPLAKPCPLRCAALCQDMKLDDLLMWSTPYRMNTMSKDPEVINVWVKAMEKCEPMVTFVWAMDPTPTFAQSLRHSIHAKTNDNYDLPELNSDENA